MNVPDPDFRPPRPQMSGTRLDGMGAPAIVIASAHHGDVLAEAFGRYEREYDVRLVSDEVTAKKTAAELMGSGHQVALSVIDTDHEQEKLYALIDGTRKACRPRDRRPDLTATMSSYLVNEIEWNPRITVRGSTYVVDGGVNHLAWITMEDADTGEQEREDVHPPEDLAITLPGVFAGGDIRSGSMKRVASATGEGASVVSSVHAWLAQ